MSSIDGAIKSNKDNLDKLKKKSLFSFSLPSMKKKGKDYTGLKTPTEQEIALNRLEVKQYLKRKRMISLISVVIGLTLVGLGYYFLQ